MATENVKKFVEDVKAGRWRFRVSVVGVDYPRGVVDVDAETEKAIENEYGARAFDLIWYGLGEKIYKMPEIEEMPSGTDITQLVIQKVLAKEAKEAEEAKRRAEMEGAIAFVRCWECGRVKIVGKIVDGEVTRMPKDEWVKAFQAFQRAWQAWAEAASQQEPLSTMGKGWISLFAQEGYKAVIVDTYYCGC